MDLDALGAVVGVKKLYPQATVVLPDTKGQEVVKLLEENPELLEFVNESSFTGEVEKLIVVDTDSIERIPESVRRALTPNTQVVVFDHHSGGFSLPEVELHHKGSGAVSSVIALILKGKGITPSPYEASVMLAGIYSDTGSFRYPSTTPIDFLAAAYLMAVGGEVEFVKKYLPKELSEREIDLLKLLKDNLRVVEVHGNPVGITYGRFDRFVGDVAPAVSRLMELYSLPALFAVVEVQATTFLIGRSRSPRIDASKVASSFGGGGHREAASASIKGKTVFEVLDELRELLERVVAPLKRAEDIMTSPVITVSGEESVKSARLTLMKNSINAAPVVDREGRIRGIVNRALLDKAAYMGLEREPVKEVMEREFYWVEPKEPISKVEEIVVERQQSFVPVVEKGKPVGVITRTDILMNLYKKEI